MLKGEQARSGPELVREWLKEARHTGAPDNYAGKRRHSRIQWSAPLQVHVSTSEGPSRTLRATARDISENGMSFTCRQPIPVYTELEIGLEGSDRVVRAAILHCTQSVGTHVIGVEFRFDK